MGTIIEFPFEKTKEYREIEEEIENEFDDRKYLDSYVYEAIVGNLSHMYGGHFDIKDKESLEMVALIGRIHRAIGNWQMGAQDPLIPYLLDMIRKLDLKKIHLVDNEP